MYTLNVRRMPKRFLDENCPSSVADITDDPKYGDRYTVIYKEIINGHVGYRGMSSNPNHPQGIGIFGEMEIGQLKLYRQAHRRKRIPFSQLPEAVQQCVIDDCTTSAD